MPIDYRKQDLSDIQKIGFFTVIGLVGYAVGMLFFGNIIISAAVIIVLWIAVLPMFKARLYEKRRDKLLIQFRDMLYSISSSVSAGRNMSYAIEESISFWSSTYDENDYIMIELNNMNRQIKNGNANDITVWRDFAERSGLEDVADFVNVYESSKNSGGDLAKAIERATTVIGEKISLENELKSMMSQKIFEGRIVGIMPLVVIGGMKIAAPDYLAPMTSEPKGQLIMAAALFLMIIAIAMIERINRIEI